METGIVRQVLGHRCIETGTGRLVQRDRYKETNTRRQTQGDRYREIQGVRYMEIGTGRKTDRRKQIQGDIQGGRYRGKIHGHR